MRSDFQIHTLGCGSAKPTVRHQPSSTVVEHRGNLFMVDCGEGAQRTFQMARLKFSRLSHIFLTHLHGDHVFGLPGLVGTLGLLQTGGSLTIHTFADGQKILSQIFKYFDRDPSFEIKWNILDPKKEETALETKSMRVRTIPLRHKVPAVGYVFEEKPSQRHLNREMADFYGVPTYMFNNLKAGMDYITPEGVTIPNARLTFDPTPPRSYAHISDTAYMPELASKIENVSLLYHETTYLEEHINDAMARGHSTARQAAMTARDAHVGALLTGHYSSRYKDEQAFVTEASEVFPHVILNHEGLVTPIGNRE
ncbi:MAG: ribonuclease Z [Muribaculaceae bacterium]|nr:ribonuclease Z [Muribaculaceae bacterium]